MTFIYNWYNKPYLYLFYTIEYNRPYLFDIIYIL